MAIADLKNVLKIFGGSEVTEDKQNDLYKEVLLMTLARAADAEHRGQAIQALADVFRSDADVSVLEVDFFNRTAAAMGVTPAQIAGLNPGSVDD